ncbi:BTAD domain-containing putative transcriptional regulator [Thermotoga sp. KOL6]|uniref:AfsR/SARP family transcriptional regulator n=1 Tax=Thermotoga sp. KOL6 TaxID=126741 RepID=UPI000C775F6B|nr:BTAD domain-containing putative transcriptional regulator [Thermotoga sp. KOL6]PLV59853.1 SARP family transcriptional regulator [Thermotoga sp. KOL6]
MKILIKTFGGTKVIKGNEFINAKDWPSQKAFSLFRYLIFRRNEEISVEELYDLFWEGMEETFARSNLNTTLYLIRRTTGISTEELYIRGSLCVFRPSERVTIDADMFEEYYRSFQSIPSVMEGEKLLKKMYEIYTGPFLIEDAFAEWVQEAREMYETWYSNVLKSLFELYLSKENYEDAFEVIKTYLNREPYDEEVYYKAIEAFAKSGQISRAKKLYDRLSKRLREIGIKPRFVFKDLLVKTRQTPGNPLVNGNRALIVDNNFFEKILFLETRKRGEGFVVLELKFRGSINEAMKELVQKVAPLFRKGDIITFTNDSIRVLAHCAKQRRPVLESRLKNVLGEMGIEKDQYTIG